MVATKCKPATITNQRRKERFNPVCQSNNSVKPTQRRKQKEKRRKLCSRLARPSQSGPIEENDRPAACGDAEQYKRQVGIANKTIE
jgi:hypothetical protein